MTCRGLEGVWPRRESQQPRQEMTKLEQRAGHSLWLRGGGMSDVVLVVPGCGCIVGVGLELHKIFLAFWVATAVIVSSDGGVVSRALFFQCDRKHEYC